MPDATEDFRLVSHADLFQFDPLPVSLGQGFHQGPEVHSAVGREVEDDLIPGEEFLHRDQIHGQLVLFDLFLAEGELLLGTLRLKFLDSGEIVVAGPPENAPRHRFHGVPGKDTGDFPPFHAAGGSDDAHLPHLEIRKGRGEHPALQGDPVADPHLVRGRCVLGSLYRNGGSGFVRL
jgi:hypothetical protein